MKEEELEAGTRQPDEGLHRHLSKSCIFGIDLDIRLSLIAHEDNLYDKMSQR